MLLACRLAGLSALGAYYAGVRARAQCRPTRSPNAASPPRPPAWLSTGAPSASRRYGRSSEKRVSEPISLDEFGPSSITGIIPSPAFDIGWPIPEFLYASHGWSPFSRPRGEPGVPYATAIFEMRLRPLQRPALLQPITSPPSRSASD